MNVLDDDQIRSLLDAMFRRRENDVRAARTFPTGIRQRVRARRLANTVASVIAIVGVVVVGAVSLAGLRGLVDRPEHRAAAGGLDGTTALTSGELRGVRWTLTGGFADGLPCTQIEMGGRTAGGCWPEISDDRPSVQLDAGVSYVDWFEGEPSSRRFTFVTAIVPRDVAQVLVRSGTHLFRSAPSVEAPDGWGPVSVAVVPIEETTSLQLASPLRVKYLDDDARTAFRADEIRLRVVPDVPTGSMVPDYVTSEGLFFSRSVDGRTLLGWRERATSKLGIWLEGPGDVLATGSTVGWAEREPLLSIRRSCRGPAGILWGAVPDEVASVEVGLVAPGRIDTIAAPRALGEVRFVLGAFEEFDPERAPVTYLDAAGEPIWTDWPGGSPPGAATPTCDRPS